MNAYTSDDLLSNYQSPTYLELFQAQLQQSQKSIVKYNSSRAGNVGDQILDNIRMIKQFREGQVYELVVGQAFDYLSLVWKHSQKVQPNFKDDVKTLAQIRINNVAKQLWTEELVIGPTIQPPLPYNYISESNQQRIISLKQQSSDLKQKINHINSTLDNIEPQNQDNFVPVHNNLYDHLYTEEKKKEVEEFVRKKREEQLQRRRKLEMSKKKEEEQLEKKYKEIKEQEEKMIKHRKEEYLRKQEELHEERKKQRSLRQQRNSEYIRVKKQIKEKPPLYVRYDEDYSKKAEFVELERKQKILRERKAGLLSIDQMDLNGHEKNYDKQREQKEKERQEKINIFLEEQSRVRYSSSVDIHYQEEPDKKEQQKEQAKQRLQKMKEYKQIVKQNYKPRIDEIKKKQLELLVQEMEMGKNKKMKKVYKDDGSIVYEEMNEGDHRIIGMMYLERTKEMAKQSMGKKRKNSSASNQLPEQHKKTVDYLAIMRENPRPKAAKLAFISNPNLSYDQKISKVQKQAHKLQEETKLNQLKLRFGKFKTSEQILNCKEEIDNNYLSIANMKLKLIKQN